MRQKLWRVIKWVGGGFLALVALFGVVYLLLPKGPRDPMEFDDPWHKERPMVEANSYVVVAGTPWATEAAMDVLADGGNAVDAAVAALLMINVTYGEAASFPGVAPVVVYDATTQTVRSYTGAGTAPAKATIDLFRDAGYETVPDFHIWAQLLPASPDVIIALLSEYGTKSFSELVAPAIKMAREGFPVHTIMAKNLDFSLVERIGFTFIMPSTAEAYMRGEWWRPIHYKDRFARPELADTWEQMAQAEQAVLQAGGSRQEGLQAVRDYFYKGPIAEAIVAFHEEEGGLFTAEDLANYSGYWEEPVQGSFGEYTFFVNGTWSQGIVVPMALQILEGIDLKSMGHNSPEYVHTVAQAIELAMADREVYVADPAFVDVPLSQLLSKAYAAERRAAMTKQAFQGMPAPGDIPGFGGVVDKTAVSYAHLSPDIDFAIGKDTSHLAIIDAQGNAVSMTPSDFPKSPMVPGTGLTLGDRMVQFRLNPDHVNALAPGKRPRITPNAVIVFKNGEFYMAYGTPGGDMQTQALIQVFLNMAVFGMDIQEAINAPRFRSYNFPDSFSPHEERPATLALEASLDTAVHDDLVARGYQIKVREDWDNEFGAVGAVIRDGNHLLAGSDPREETWADGR